MCLLRALKFKALTLWSFFFQSVNKCPRKFQRVQQISWIFWNPKQEICSGFYLNSSLMLLHKARQPLYSRWLTHEILHFYVIKSSPHFKTLPWLQDFQWATWCTEFCACTHCIQWTQCIHTSKKWKSLRILLFSLKNLRKKCVNRDDKTLRQKCISQSKV